MKTQFQAQLLQHFLKKKNNSKGFTLIELLVVVIIIGILAAVALPSMLNQASRARLAGARNAAGAINRAQQTFRLENNEFAASLEDLNLGTNAGTVDGYEPVEIGEADAAANSAFFASTNTADVSSVVGCVQAVDSITDSAVVGGQEGDPDEVTAESCSTAFEAEEGGGEGG